MIKMRSTLVIALMLSCSARAGADNTDEFPFLTQSKVVKESIPPARPKPPPNSRAASKSPATKAASGSTPAASTQPAAVQTGVMSAKNNKRGSSKRGKQKKVVVLDKPLPKLNERIRNGGLPGLGLPPGKAKAIKPLVIDIANGVNEMVTVSNLMPNRIATPYKKPRVIDASGAEIQTVGSNVFILPQGDEPFGIYITGYDDDLPVASLTLVPRQLPSQNILLQVDRRMEGIARLSDKEDRPTPEEYTRRLVFMLRKAMTGRMPDGFVLSSINVGRIEMGPIIGRPDKRWSSSKLDIYRYKLTNKGEDIVELTEPSFYESGVKAVSFYPSRTKLRPGEHTYAYIVSGNTSEAIFQKNPMTHIVDN